MIMVEHKVAELERAISFADTTISKKIEDMKKFVQDVEGRFGQLERALPERLHNFEERQSGCVGMINEITQAVNSKIEQI